VMYGLRRDAARLRKSDISRRRQVLLHGSKLSEADSCSQVAQNEEPKLMCPEMAERRKKPVKEADGPA